MVDEIYKLNLTLQVMKEQRRKMISDFTDNYDVTMLEGLHRFNHSAEYNVYSELYHVLWIDSHWNHLQRKIGQDIEIESDKRLIEQYFSKCFLVLQL